jgi:hypothetical protein
MSAGFASSGSGGQGFAIKLEKDGDTKLGNSDGDLHQVTGTLHLNNNVFFLANGRVGINTDSPAYKLGVAGNVGINEYIYHNGDADTFIRFQDDSINFQAGGKDFITITEGATDELVFNESDTDIDLRVESNHNTHMFHIDGANSRIGIGTNSAQSVLHIVDPFDAYSGSEKDAVIIVKSKKEVGIKLISDSGNDNTDGEENNPFIDFYQDGEQDTSARGRRIGSIGLEGSANATFTGSIGNAFFMDAFHPNTGHSNRNLQLANTSTNGGHKARITLEGTNGFVGIHTSTPGSPLEVSGNVRLHGTTTSQFYVTEVAEQDLGSGTSSTLTLASGTMLLDADSINGIDMGGMEVHGLAIPRGGNSGTRLSLILKGSSNNVFVLPSGLISGSFDSLNPGAGVTSLEFMWISEGTHQAWHQVK